MAAVLANTDRLILELRPAATLGLLPKEIGHTNSADRGDRPRRVVHVPTEAIALMAGLSAGLHHLEREVGAAALFTLHESVIRR
ncbi:hypothetical protein ACFWB5_08585 [Corynebacterium xerosis]|uniref:hypothetical protein n=1 Tax=Corynebacterium xerosis TaxID=1725 RepID=UPI00366A349C